MGRVIEIRHPRETAARGAITPPRLDIVDVARGAALAMMIVYHLVWDFEFFGLIGKGIAASPPMRGFSHAIASAFLLIAGVSVALAHRGTFKGAAFRKQFAKVALAAAAVTLATTYVMPQAPVTFGILHAMALGVLLTAIFAKAPWGLTLALALAMILAPFFIHSPVFDRPALQWLGLGTDDPNALDWRPALPWTGVMLLGLALARSPRGQAFLVRADEFKADEDAISRALRWLGKRTLPIYLLHQPVLFGVLYVAALMLGVAPQFGADRGFVEACRTECLAKGASAEVCANACGCVVETVKRSGRWDEVLKNSPAGDEAATEAAKLCMPK
jgi:uncharacterized membrane protein